VDLKKVGESIVDLRKSAWDAATSDPDNGVYNFTKIKLVPTKGTSECEHELTWSRYDATNGYRELNAHRSEGYTPVLVSQNLYFPQGAYKNSAGMWQFDDVVLIMRPMAMFLEKRAGDVTTSEKMVENVLGSYDSDLRKQGSQAEGVSYESRRIV
jgi:hypothetical protein